jgi:hypothetical protein
MGAAPLICPAGIFSPLGRRGRKWHPMLMTSAVRFVFTGEINCASFVGFARHRASRLNLRMDVGACTRTSATMTVGGQEALVDMFEMACSLGPYDCIVHDVTRTDTDFPASTGGISGENG